MKQQGTLLELMFGHKANMSPTIFTTPDITHEEFKFWNLNFGKSDTKSTEKLRNTRKNIARYKRKMRGIIKTQTVFNIGDKVLLRS